MEYIEPKPIEKKPHATRNKVIIGSIVCVVTLAAVGVGTYFLIDRVFADFDYAELYSYTYVRDEDNNITGSIILKADHTITAPAKLRIPRKLGGQPVVSISDEAFFNMDTIVEINFPDTIKSIGKKAFYDCDNLTTFNVPSALDSLGTDAFSETKWYNEAPNGEVKIGKFLYAFKGQFSGDTIICSKTSSLRAEYPTIDDDHVIDLSEFSHLSNGVFRNQEKLLAVEIPETVKEINDATFSGCSNIQKLSLLGDIDSIGAEAFKDCKKLTSISGFGKVKSFGKNSFDGCDLSGELTLSDVTLYIGDASFKGNTHLTKFTFNNNVNAVPRYCFEGCTSLADVVFSENEYNPATSHIAYLQDNAFKGTAISYMNIPYNVITLGSGVFSECPNLTGVTLYSNENATKFISRTSKDGVYGEWGAIEGQVQGVRAMGKELFKDSPLFEELVLVNENGAKTASKEVRIPQTLTSFGSSDSYSFKNTSITKVDFTQEPTDAYKDQFAGLTSISEALFADASKLETVTLDNNTKEIINGAFKNCVSLTSIVIPGKVGRMDANIFEGCSKLASVTFSKDADGKTNVSSIKPYVFKDCVELTSVAVPDSVTEIGNNAFEGCVKLASVTFSSQKDLTTIGAEAFMGCTNLVTINLPNQSLRSLGAKAFYNCAKLEELDFSSSIKELPSEVISGCESLTTLTFRRTAVVQFKSALDYDAETGVIKNCPSLTTIYVPESEVQKYSEHKVWKNYTIVAIPAVS